VSDHTTAHFVIVGGGARETLTEQLDNIGLVVCRRVDQQFLCRKKEYFQEQK
jgi:hypothetical protein